MRDDKVAPHGSENKQQQHRIQRDDASGCVQCRVQERQCSPQQSLHSVSATETVCFIQTK